MPRIWKNEPKKAKKNKSKKTKKCTGKPIKELIKC